MIRAIRRWYWRHMVRECEEAIAEERERRAAFPGTISRLMHDRRRALLNVDRLTPRGRRVVRP